MKIPAVQQSCYRQYHRMANKNTSPAEQSSCKELGLQNCFYYPTNISFGLENSQGLKKLFSYGLPCIYTGVEMIEPQKISNLLKKDLNKITAMDICKYIDPMINSLMPKEKEVYLVIRDAAEKEPEKKFKDLLGALRTQYEHELVRKQYPIFKALVSYSYSLPENLQPQFLKLMEDTEKKIKRTPVSTRFSVTEFRYKLKKIKDDIGKLHDKKQLGIVNHFLKLSENFEPKTNVRNINSQRKVLTNMKAILDRSMLRNNSDLQELFETSRLKFNEQEILVPFSRKTFIYDLSQIIKNLDNSELKEIFMKIAEKLPTSKDSTAAYIAKLSNETTERAISHLLCPSMASVEHLLPRSCNGQNIMANYAGACASENSDRQSIPFIEQLKRKPNTPKYCQKYVDRLIKYVKKGIFEKEGIDIKYIEDFKNTIAELSEGSIILDTSNLYKNNRFLKEEPVMNFI